jgi:diguanylate cyclase (GGDEF)-like protein
VTSLDDPSGSSGEHDLLRQLGRHSSAAVPIVVAGTTWGEVWACRDAGFPVFSSRDIRFLQTIAGQLAAAVGRTELFARMADLAFRDPLTGVGNRRALEERLELLVADALEAGRGLSVLLCDVDNLKELNDHQGHTAGDDALRRLAQALAAEVPDDPLVYRLGGDEFCLVLPDVTAEEAVALGERVLWRLSTEPPSGLTASCGVASLEMGVRRAADLLRAADAAQYAAKRGGRSRVCLADPRGAVDWRRPLPVAHGSRRRYRELGTTIEIPALVDEVLAALDGPLARAPTLARLEDVMTRILPLADGARVAVSFSSRDGRTIDSAFTLDGRRGRVWRRELAGMKDTESPIGRTTA